MDVAVPWRHRKPAPVAMEVNVIDVEVPRVGVRFAGIVEMLVQVRVDMRGSGVRMIVDMDTVFVIVVDDVGVILVAEGRVCVIPMAVVEMV